MSQQSTQQKRLRTKRKIRSIISGTAERPRMSVSRTNNFLSVQLIDDTKGHTIVSATDMPKKAAKGTKSGTKMAGAIAVGTQIATLATAAGITTVVFDRNGFKYAGRIKACADAARAGGLKF